MRVSTGHLATELNVARTGADQRSSEYLKGDQSNERDMLTEQRGKRGRVLLGYRTVRVISDSLQTLIRRNVKYR